MRMVCGLFMAQAAAVLVTKRKVVWISKYDSRSRRIGSLS